MKKSRTNVFFLIIIFTSTVAGLDLNAQNDINLMKNLISKRIRLDLATQDTSIFLINLTAGVDVKKLMGDKYCDTCKFTFQDGCYLRFYLLSSGTGLGNTSLKLLRPTGVKRLPYVIIKEIKSGINVGEIQTFDYYTKKIEDFCLILKMNNQAKGCAVAAITQYVPKKTRTESNVAKSN